MSARFALPSAGEPRRPLLARSRVFLLETWKGRILLGSGLLWTVERLGAPVPGFFSALAHIFLWLFAAWGAWRLARAIVWRFLWRIRTKLIVSYLFIAVVPLVLLGMLFALAALLFGGLVGGHLVSAEVARDADVLGKVAGSALVALPADGTVNTVLDARLQPARGVHPELSYAYVRRGRTVARVGDAPVALPAWLSGKPAFAGLVSDGDNEMVRAVAASGDAFLVLQVPLDARLFSSLEQRLGIRPLTSGGRMRTRPGKDGGHDLDVDVAEHQVHHMYEGEANISGMPFVAPTDRTDWQTGETSVDPVTLSFNPRELVRNLSPGTVNTADLLVTALTIVGAIFLVMYGVALLIGWLLARSITKSVHALSVGTEHLRAGDFGMRIPIHSRDQLGDLAESFNAMAAGMQALMLEQAEKQRLEEELRIARQIQMSLLPQSNLSLPGLRIAALCLPAAEVGGDYYDLLPLSDTRMGVLVADVSGKGTSAALYMAELKGLVLSLSRIYESPARLLSEANRILAATLDPRSFVTMTYAVIDTAARTMRYARAGHNPIIHLDARTGDTHVLAPPGMGLGLDRGDTFDRVLEEHEVALRPDDVFLFFTDGLSEAMNTRSELFGETRLRDLIERCEALGSEEIKDEILRDVRLFVGEAAQHDDMTMVILKIAEDAAR